MAVLDKYKSLTRESLLKDKDDKKRQKVRERLLQDKIKAVEDFNKIHLEFILPNVFKVGEGIEALKEKERKDLTTEPTKKVESLAKTGELPGVVLKNRFQETADRLAGEEMLEREKETATQQFRQRSTIGKLFDRDKETSGTGDGMDYRYGFQNQPSGDYPGVNLVTKEDIEKQKSGEEQISAIMNKNIAEKLKKNVNDYFGKFGIKKEDIESTAKKHKVTYDIAGQIAYEESKKKEIPGIGEIFQDITSGKVKDGFNKFSNAFNVMTKDFNSSLAMFGSSIIQGITYAGDKDNPISWINPLGKVTQYLTDLGMEKIGLDVEGNNIETKKYLAEVRDKVNKWASDIGSQEEYQEYISRPYMQGAGSMVGFILTTALSRGLNLTHGSAASIFGALSTAGSMAYDTEKQTGDIDKAYLSFLAGLPLGATERFGIGKLFGDIDAMTGGSIKTIFKIAGREALEEFIQEGGQTFGEATFQNYITGSKRDALREAMENALIAAPLAFLFAGGTGVGMRTGVKVFNSIKDRIKKEKPKTDAPVYTPATEKIISAVKEKLKTEKPKVTKKPETVEKVEIEGVDEAISDLGLTKVKDENKGSQKTVEVTKEDVDKLKTSLVNIATTGEGVSLEGITKARELADKSKDLFTTEQSKEIAEFIDGLNKKLKEKPKTLTEQQAENQEFLTKNKEKAGKTIDEIYPEETGISAKDLTDDELKSEHRDYENRLDKLDEKQGKMPDKEFERYLDLQGEMITRGFVKTKETEKPKTLITQAEQDEIDQIEAFPENTAEGLNKKIAFAEKMLDPDRIKNLRQLDPKDADKVVKNWTGKLDQYKRKLESLKPENTEKVTDKTGVKSTEGFVEVELTAITKDLKNYQGRQGEEYSDQTFNRIVNEHKEGKLIRSAIPPIQVFVRENGKMELLAGHSRLAAWQELAKSNKDFKTIPTQFLRESEGVTFEQAQKIAQESNQGAVQKDTDNAVYFRKLRGKLKPAELRKQAENLYGKNAAYVTELSYLSPKGKTFTMLVSLNKSEDKAQQNRVSDIASWVGNIRRLFETEISDKHENEMFDWLMRENNYKGIKNKTDFRDKVKTIVERYDFNRNEPLNLPEDQLLSNAEKEYRRKVASLETEIKEAKAREKEENRNLVKRKVDKKDITNDDINRMIQPMRDSIIQLEEELIELKKQEGKYKEAGEGEIGLFGPATPPKKEGFAEGQSKINQVKDEIDDIEAEIIKKLGKLKTGYDPELALLTGKLVTKYVQLGFYKLEALTREFIRKGMEKLLPYLREAYVKLRTDDSLSPAIINSLDDEQTTNRFDPERFNSSLSEAERESIQGGSPVPRTDRGESGAGRPALRYANQRNLPDAGQRVPVGKYEVDEHQRYGINLALDRFLDNLGRGFGLFDGTGVGKTRQELVIAKEIKKAKPDLPVLIITDSNRVVKKNFTPEARQLNIALTDFEIGTYSDLRAGKIGKAPKYGLVVYDEAHNLKNAGTGKTEAARDIKADHILFGTATPMDRIVSALYFLHELSDVDMKLLAEKIGVNISYQQDMFGKAEIPIIEPKEGVSEKQVIANVIGLRNKAIENGAMIRREYPFFGKVERMEVQMTSEDIERQDTISEYWQNRIKKVWKRGDLTKAEKIQKAMNIGGIRKAELEALTESGKAKAVFAKIEKDLAEGRSVIVATDLVESTTINSIGLDVMSALDQIKEMLDEAGVKYGELYGGEAKRNLKGINDFNDGSVKVLLMTQKTGGVGINLDDTKGDAPRSMYILSPSHSGDVFQQVLGRISRRNTLTESMVHLVFMPQAVRDQARRNIVERKLRTLHAIQEGEDMDEQTVETTRQDVRFQKSGKPIQIRFQLDFGANRITILKALKSEEARLKEMLVTTPFELGDSRYSRLQKKVGETQAEIKRLEQEIAGMKPIENELGDDQLSMFQHEGYTRATKDYLYALSKKLNEAFPGIEVVMQSTEEMLETLKGIGYYFTTESVPFGFKGPDNRVYINEDRAGLDTPIHEFGHIWLRWAELFKPVLYSEGLRLAAKDEALIKEIKLKYPEYEDGSVEQMEEVLATAIGRNGIGMYEGMAEREKLTEGFVDWLKRLWNKIKEAIGAVQGMTLRGFTENAAKDMLSGREITDATSLELETMWQSRNLGLQKFQKGETKQTELITRIEDALNRWDNGEFTDQDVIEETATALDIEVSDGIEGVAELESEIREYQSELREDFEEDGGRGDSGTTAEKLVTKIQEFVSKDGKNKNEVVKKNNLIFEDGKRIDLEDIIPDDAMDIFNQRFWGLSGVKVPKKMYGKTKFKDFVDFIESYGIGDDVFLESTIALRKLGYRELGDMLLTAKGMKLKETKALPEGKFTNDIRFHKSAIPETSLYVRKNGTLSNKVFDANTAKLIRVGASVIQDNGLTDSKKEIIEEFGKLINGLFTNARKPFALNNEQMVKLYDASMKFLNEKITERQQKQKAAERSDSKIRALLGEDDNFKDRTVYDATMNIGGKILDLVTLRGADNFFKKFIGDTIWEEEKKLFMSIPWMKRAFDQFGFVPDSEQFRALWREMSRGASHYSQIAKEMADSLYFRDLKRKHPYLFIEQQLLARMIKGETPVNGKITIQPTVKNGLQAPLVLDMTELKERAERVRKLQDEMKKLGELYEVLPVETYNTKLPRKRIAWLLNFKADLEKMLEKGEGKIKWQDSKGNSTDLVFKSPEAIQERIESTDKQVKNSFKRGGEGYFKRVYLTKEQERLTKKYGITKPTRLDLTAAIHREDIDLADRVKMGEILTAAYPVAKSILLTGKDISIGGFFEGIAENPAWASDVTAEGWIKAGDNKKLGKLANMWVHPEVWDIVNETVEINSTDYADKFMRQLTGMWKQTKVVMNPPTVMRNFYTNSIMLDYSGVNPVHQMRLLPQALDEIRGKGKYSREMDYIRGSTFVTAEMEKFLDEFKVYDSKQQAQDRWKSLPTGEKFLKVMSKATLAGTKVGMKAADFYKFAEVLFKTVKFLHGKEKGMTNTEAIDEAQKWLYDYEDIPKWVRSMRQSWWGMPFATWSYKTMPRVIEAAVTRPLTFAKYYFIIKGVMEYALSQLSISPEEWEEIYANLPDRMRQGQWLLLPYRDDNGNLQTLDLTYIMPFSDLYKMGLTAVTLATTGETATGDDVLTSLATLMGNPVFTMSAEIGANISRYTKRPIWKETDTPGVRMQKTFDYMYKLWLPSWYPEVPGMTRGGYVYDKLRSAITKRPDYYGRVSDIMPALFSTAGLKITPVDVGKNIDDKIKRNTANILELQKDKQMVLRDQSITREERVRKTDEIDNRIRLLTEENTEHETRQEPKTMAEQLMDKYIRGLERQKSEEEDDDKKQKLQKEINNLKIDLDLLRDYRYSENQPGFDEVKQDVFRTKVNYTKLFDGLNRQLKEAIREKDDIKTGELKKFIEDLSGEQDAPKQGRDMAVEKIKRWDGEMGFLRSVEDLNDKYREYGLKQPNGKDYRYKLSDTEQKNLKIDNVRWRRLLRDRKNDLREQRRKGKIDHSMMLEQMESIDKLLGDTQ